uniref:Ribosomal protein S11 n=1 Tax=Dracocephalum heterophyllum TaxID=768177 RepID=A0A8E8L9G8_9LAMI|nr:ribosomal protein S11 [Dracocephalum heterophyllum]
MAKAIPRTGLCRNLRIGARKSARKIPKGVIHVQASFNNKYHCHSYRCTKSPGPRPVLVDSRGREEEQLKLQQQMLLVQ